MNPDPAAAAAVLRPAAVRLMACTAALGAANLYYNQPLLAQIGAEFAAGPARTGIIPTLTQVGYALGMLLLVPLGDKFERRGLTVLSLVATALALCAAAAAPTLACLAAASAAVGVVTVSPQLVLPLAAELAPPARRGAVIGTVMSGLIVGILLARGASGLVGARLGWRPVFLLAGAAMAAMGLAVRLGLPRSRPSFPGSYRSLLGSVFVLAAREPTLRQCCAIGALAFASLNGFWATLAFLLGAAPFGLGPAAVGGFGLVGAASAAAAAAAGRLADRIDPRRTCAMSLVAMLVGWGVLYAGRQSLWGLGVGVVVIDVGLQGVHISNQARVYALDAAARSRLNTGYMTACFAGAAAGSAVASAAWSWRGWAAVCAVQGLLAALGAVGTLRGWHRRAMAGP